MHFDASMALNAWKDARRILAIRLDNIGDIIMLGPALRALKNAIPHAEITLMASPAGSQVAPMLPWVDEVITWRAVWQDVSGALPQEPEREERLFEELRSRQFDAALIFTSFSQSPYPPAYAAYMAGIPVRIGQSSDFGGGLLTHWVKPYLREGHQTDRNLHLLQSIGIPATDLRLELHVPEEAERRATALLQGLGIGRADRYLVLAPGASCAARRYDPASFAQVARLMVEMTGLPLVIVGSQRETTTIAPALAAVNGAMITSLVGKTSLEELASVIHGASLVIANNSASLHIADAFQVPMVILYSGAELESQWKPRSSPARLLRRDTFCSPCHLFDCPYSMECLDFSPREVAAAAVRLLEALGTGDVANRRQQSMLMHREEGI